MRIDVILDIILVCIIAYCVWNGFRSGLVLSVLSIVSIFVALSGANYAATTYSHILTPAFEPFVSGLVDQAVDDALLSFDPDSLLADAIPAISGSINVTNNDASDDIPDEVGSIDIDGSHIIIPSEFDVYDVSVAAIGNLGLLSGIAASLAQELSDKATDVGHTLKSAMVTRLSELFAFVVVAIVAFIIILVGLSVIAYLLNLLFRLPGLRLLNELGGAVLGLMKGVIVIFAIAWSLRFFGALINEEVIDQTMFWSFFINNNPITNIFGI